MVCVSNDGGGTTLATATSGWTFLGTQAMKEFTRCAMCYKIAASSSETAPTITGAVSDMIATALVIKDAHATPFGASPASGTDYVRGDWGNSTNISFGDSSSVTTPDDGRLLIYFMCTDGGNMNLRFPINSAIGLDTYGSDNTCHIIGMVQQESAGAAPTVRGYATTQFEGGNFWTFAIKNKSGGSKAPMLRGAVNELNWYGNFGAQHQSVTWQTPDNFAASIGGISTGTSGMTTSTGNSNSLTPWGTLTELRSALSTAGAWAGATHTITSTDMTGLVFGIQWQLNTGQSYTRAGSEGVIVCFSDGTNWIAYQIWNTSKPYVVGTADTAFIALGNATAYASSGSINWAAVTRIGYFWHRKGSDATQDNLAIKNAVLMGTSKITGGGSSYPAHWGYIVAQFAGMGHYKLAELQGSGQVLGKCSLQIGDGGTNQTYWDSSAKSLEYPPAWSSTLTDPWQMSWNAGSNAVTVGIYAGASDTLNITAGIVASATNQSFSVSASSNTSATYSLAGSSVIGFDVTGKTGVNFNSATFKQCGMIDLKGSDPTNLIMSNGLDSATCAMSDGGSLTGCALTASTASAYGIRIAAAGTINLASTTFSGFTKDIDVTATTGTVTVICAAGQATPTYQTAGATVDIQADLVYQSVAVSGLETTWRIQIYDLTSSTELYNGVPGTASYTWTDGTAASASRAIRLRVMNGDPDPAAQIVMIDTPIGTCGTTSGTEAIAYLVNSEADTVSDQYAVDGSTITGMTITDSVFRLTISSGTIVNYDGTDVLVIQAKNMYAYETYWLGTEEGIRDEARFIDAIDAANLEFHSFKILGNSGYPILIVGAYVRDAATGIAATMIDYTGDPIHFAPDHVVNNIVTVGGENIITGDISTVLAAIPSASSNAAALATRVLEGSYTWEQAFRILAAPMAGKVSGAGTGTETFLGLDGTTPRVTATVDESGNRTAITYDGT